VVEAEADQEEGEEEDEVFRVQITHMKRPTDNDKMTDAPTIVCLSRSSNSVVCPLNYKGQTNRMVVKTELAIECRKSREEQTRSKWVRTQKTFLGI
jgi:hypothetical protein